MQRVLRKAPVCGVTQTFCYPNCPAGSKRPLSILALKLSRAMKHSSHGSKRWSTLALLAWFQALLLSSPQLRQQTLSRSARGPTWSLLNGGENSGSGTVPTLCHSAEKGIRIWGLHWSLIQFSEPSLEPLSGCYLNHLKWSTFWFVLESRDYKRHFWEL